MIYHHTTTIEVVICGQSHEIALAVEYCVIPGSRGSMTEPPYPASVDLQRVNVKGNWQDIPDWLWSKLADNEAFECELLEAADAQYRDEKAEAAEARREAMED